MKVYDERGYIEVYSKSGKLKGYLESIDYGTLCYKVVGEVDLCKRYIQEDLLFHDLMLLQGYCRCCGDRFVYVMPYRCM